MKKIFVMLVLSGILIANLSFAEELTITTYYPAPFGVYEQVVMKTLGVGDNNDDNAITNADAPTPPTNPDDWGDVWIAGDVGIGTGVLMPSAKLEVKRSSTSGMGSVAMFTNENDSSAANGLVVGIANSTATDTFILDARSANTSRLYVGANGRVGIGNTQPRESLDVLLGNAVIGSLSGNYTLVGARRLTVFGDGTNIALFHPGSNKNENFGLEIGFDATNTAMRLNTKYSGDLAFAFGGTEKMRIDWDGNVGIGTIQPLNRLHVEGNGILIRPHPTWSSGDVANIYLGDTLSYLRNTWGSAVNQGVVLYANSHLSLDRANGQAIIFKQNGIEQMRIDSGGNVGIGTSTPGEKLTVNGNVDVNNGTVFLGWEIISQSQTGGATPPRVDCATGKKVVGGGIKCNVLVSATKIEYSYPVDDANGSGWIGKCVPFDQTLYAICANVVD